MGSVPRRRYPELCCPMGEIAEELPAAQSDSDGSSTSLDVGESSDNPLNRCRWAGCGRWFGHLDLLASHVTRVHATCGQGGLFYCGWEGCARGNRGFNARYKMLVHVRTHTNEKPHQCFKCDKSFSRAENLKIHARSHTGERPYVCPVPGCGKAYSNSSDRFKHTRTHSVDKPYMCKVPGCSKRYTDPSSLRKHVKTYRHFQNVCQEKMNDPITDNQIYNEETLQFHNSGHSTSENEEEHTKENLIEPMEESNSFPNQSDSSNNCFGDRFSEIKNQSFSNSTESSDVSYFGSNSCHFHQWPRPEYNLFCSWLSLWSNSLSNNQEQDLPLDLTVHRTTGRI
ncbi:hypothetical protein R5R35_001519 [Gryllus longicercus]|uniref:C2H2-type domain-containing protein n=1 Tax=Gryllus longicercus TaxID=2509291 RepID=A0AAN9ZJX5_9ORTH